MPLKFQHPIVLSLQPFVSALLCGLPVLRPSGKAVRALHRPPLLTALREVKTPNNKGDTVKYKGFGKNQTWATQQVVKFFL